MKQPSPKTPAQVWLEVETHIREALIALLTLPKPDYAKLIQMATLAGEAKSMAETHLTAAR